MTDAGDESIPGWEELNESNLSPSKKRRKLLGGQYACDLCDKIFQKSSSLLRHKYEHTGTFYKHQWFGVQIKTAGQIVVELNQDSFKNDLHKVWHKHNVHF